MLPLLLLLLLLPLLLLVQTPQLLEASPVNLESLVKEEPEKLLVPSLRKLELEFSLD